MRLLRSIFVLTFLHLLTPSWAQVVCRNAPTFYSVTLPNGPNVGQVHFTGWEITAGGGSIESINSPETNVTWSYGPGTIVGSYTWEDLEQIDPQTNQYFIHSESESFNVEVLAIPEFVVMGGGAVCAGAPGQTITLPTSVTGYNYQLIRDATSNIGPPKPGTGSPLTWTGLTTVGTYTVASSHTSYECASPMLGEAVITNTPSPPQFVPHVSFPGPYRRAIIGAIGSGNSSTHYWQEDPLGTTILDNTSTTYPVSTTRITESQGIFYIARYDAGGNCWSFSNSVEINLNNTPPPAEVIHTKFYGYNTIDINIPDKSYALAVGHAKYYFQTSENAEVVDPLKLWAPGYKIFADGTYFIRGIDDTEVWGPTTPFVVKLKKDWDLNFLVSRGFDGSHEEAIVAESKGYFDGKGKSLQSQSRSIATNRIFVSESIQDHYDRTVGGFLPAPLAGTDFRYNALFTLTTSGNSFNFNDFNNPAPLSTNLPGTVGWYYSSNNTDEPLTPETDVPYTRSTFYEDGFGEPLASARPGVVHKIGTGHESLSGTFPVHNELNDYWTRRPNFIAGLSQVAPNLLHAGVQTVVKDENGKYPLTNDLFGYAISIADKSGKTVMTARPGTSFNNVLTIANQVDLNGVTNPIVYFYIFSPQAVTIVGAGYTIYDMVTNQVVTPSGTWPAGFYRVRAAGHWAFATISYTNYYLDVAYQFYDDAGRLKATLSPNGYKQLTVGGITNTALLDKTSYVYNHQGWLLEMTEPDAGTTRYGYRKDSRIRFSQNAKQAKDSVYSYTSYDALGRPVESGEYNPGGSTVYFDEARFNSTKLEEFGNSWMEGGATKDWIRTHYDLPATPNFSFPSGYVQKFLRGAVSWTENKNIQTFYSYNEKGQVTWMIQRPKPLIIGQDTIDLNRSFLLSYSYDHSGNVLDVTYVPFESNGTLKSTERFVHYYEYDADKRLIKTLSGTDGVHKKLRAQYSYYLHGPLKRIELGDHLQGIDFVYNIHGWLTAINNPDTNNDPGSDGKPGAHSNFKKDAFGMILDYYESSMGGLFTASLMDNPDIFHHIPTLNGEELTVASLARPLHPFDANESIREIQRTIRMMKEGLKAKD